MNWRPEKESHAQRRLGHLVGDPSRLRESWRLKGSERAAKIFFSSHHATAVLECLLLKTAKVLSKMETAYKCSVIPVGFFSSEGRQAFHWSLLFSEESHTGKQSQKQCLKRERLIIALLQYLGSTC